VGEQIEDSSRVGQVRAVAEVDIRRKGSRRSSPGRMVSNLSQSLDDPDRVGNKLRKAREELGLTQIDVAERSGYSNGWISLIERGWAVPTTTCLRRLEIVLNGADLGASTWQSRPRKGDVGDWGMTPTEVAGFVGLSRTRIYDLMRAYTELQKDVVDPSSDRYGLRLSGSDLYHGFMPWIDADGIQRVSIKDCARWVIYGDGSADSARDAEELELMIQNKEQEIREWLKTRRT
jgi:ribosome-binding protein aMBF1 (putative translation factor)